MVERAEGLADALAKRGAAQPVARQLAAAVAGNDWTPVARVNARRLIEAQTDPQTQYASGSKVLLFLPRAA
ncbi:MAG: hypothetical protein H0U97_06210 [Gammaproteobacteria bacterium]|nr:hypothetical protein [Gammaproteobacteria bacterium]